MKQAIDIATAKLSNDEQLRIRLAVEPGNLDSILQNKLRQLRLTQYPDIISAELCPPEMHSTFIPKIEAMDLTMAFIDLEWLLISFIPMSPLMVGVSLGICLLTGFALSSCSYYFRSKLATEKFLYKQDTLFFSYMQNAIANHMTPTETPKLQQPQPCFNNTYAHQHTIDKHLLPALAINSGLILTLAWAIPDFLVAFGVSATTITALTPIGFILCGVAAVLLTVALTESYQKRHDALNVYKQGLVASQMAERSYLISSASLPPGHTSWPLASAAKTQ